MSASPSLVWFRQDLRLSDNPAVAAAVEQRSPLIPVFVWAPEEEGAWPPGAASRWWLGRSLARLSEELEHRGSLLIIRRGPTAEAISRLAAESGATAVFWNRRYEPAAVARDSQVKSKLRERGLLAESFNGSLLSEPETILNRSGQPFRVFTAFWRACLTKLATPASKDAPKRLLSPENWPHSLDISELGLEPAVDWASGFREVWQPGESGAARQLKRFLEKALAGYLVDRERPGVAGTSRLSPHLHFGEISPGQVWRAVLEAMDENAAGCQAYLRQIGWREFAYYLLHHHSESPQEALRHGFAAFPWRMDPQRFKAWKQGRTGYPLVDAGMRELWHTGWMHNRVRMVAASFLVKHLLIGWQDGAAWFWDTLVDADLANNTLGWQWVAGCGADAAPYFRIFNPSIQAEKFDSEGEYRRRWVPESESSPAPHPIVDHAEARDRALEALASIRNR
ncbi:MAG: cryptochrome/photolyase family protein [Bryobacteraceae bacterium]